MNSFFYRYIAVGTAVLSAVLLIATVFLVAQVFSLNSQLSEATDIAKLKTEYVWVTSGTSVTQQPNQYTEWQFTTQYAGYVTIYVLDSTSDKTYVQVIYESSGVVFNSGKVDVTSRGIESFPVLPGNIIIRIGNNEPANAASETLAVTLHY